jgi:hypothetical protein
MAQYAEFECGNQNCTMSAPATNSAARVMAPEPIIPSDREGQRRIDETFGVGFE